LPVPSKNSAYRSGPGGAKDRHRFGAREQLTAQFAAPFHEVFHLLAVGCRTIKRGLLDGRVGYGDSEAAAKMPQFLLVKGFLLMGDIAALTGFSQAVALDGFGQNDGWSALVFHGGFVGGIDLLRIVAAAPQLLELLVTIGAHHIGHFRVFFEKIFADIVTTGHRVHLVLTVRDFFHAFGQQPVFILGQQRVPVAAPDHLDDIPAGAAEGGFQFLHDFAVAAHRPVQTLQIAIDDKDQVVKLLAGRQGDGAQRLGLIQFTVAEKSPDFLIAELDQVAIFEVAVEPGLVDGHDR